MNFVNTKKRYLKNERQWSMSRLISLIPGAFSSLFSAIINIKYYNKICSKNPKIMLNVITTLLSRHYYIILILRKLVNSHPCTKYLIHLFTFYD